MVGIQFVLSLGQVGIYTADLRLVYHICMKGAVLFKIKLYDENKRNEILKRIRNQKQGKFPDYLRNLYYYFVDKSFVSGSPGKWCYSDYGEMVEAVIGIDDRAYNKAIREMLILLARMDYIDYICIDYDEAKANHRRPKWVVTIHRELDF